MAFDNATTVHLKTLIAENARLRAALEEIATSRFTSYANTRHGIYAGEYGIGVTDGHRACAKIAKEALYPTRDTLK